MSSHDYQINKRGKISSKHSNIQSAELKNISSFLRWSLEMNNNLPVLFKESLKTCKGLRREHLFTKEDHMNNSGNYVQKISTPHFSNRKKKKTRRKHNYLYHSNCYDGRVQKPPLLHVFFQSTFCHCINNIVHIKLELELIQQRSAQNLLYPLLWIICCH